MHCRLQSDNEGEAYIAVRESSTNHQGSSASSEVAFVVFAQGIIVLVSFLRSLGYFCYKPVGLPFGLSEVVDIGKLGKPNPQVVFDVGANVGSVASRYAAAWPDALIHAFEPIPSNFHILEAVSRRNPRIVAIPRAVGRKSGIVAVKVRGIETHTLIDAINAEDASADRITVQVTTIEEYCGEREINRINLLKTDTEGFDLEVLKGAEGLLRNGRVDLILSEIEFRKRPTGPHTNFFALHSYLVPFGYNLATIYTEAMDADGFFYGSALFVGSTRRG